MQSKSKVFRKRANCQCRVGRNEQTQFGGPGLVNPGPPILLSLMWNR